MIISFHIIIYCHQAVCCKLLTALLNKPLVSEQNVRNIFLKILSFRYASQLLQPRTKFLLSGTLHLHEILESALILVGLP
jgi:hypothetical protein